MLIYVAVDDDSLQRVIQHERHLRQVAENVATQRRRPTRQRPVYAIVMRGRAVDPGAMSWIPISRQWTDVENEGLEVFIVARVSSLREADHDAT